MSLESFKQGAQRVIRLGLLAELLAIIALIAGIPVLVAGTVALIAATPTSAAVIYRILRTDKTGMGVLNVLFFFFTWAMIPCLLLLHVTNGVDENVFRFVVAVRIFAAVSAWDVQRKGSVVCKVSATEINQRDYVADDCDED